MQILHVGKLCLSVDRALRLLPHLEGCPEGLAPCPACSLKSGTVLVLKWLRFLYLRVLHLMLQRVSTEILKADPRF